MRAPGSMCVVLQILTGSSISPASHHADLKDGMYKCSSTNAQQHHCSFADINNTLAYPYNAARSTRSPCLCFQLVCSLMIPGLFAPLTAFHFPSLSLQSATRSFPRPAPCHSAPSRYTRLHLSPSRSRLSRSIPLRLAELLHSV